MLDATLRWGLPAYKRSRQSADILVRSFIRTHLRSGCAKHLVPLCVAADKKVRAPMIVFDRQLRME